MAITRASNKFSNTCLQRASALCGVSLATLLSSAALAQQAPTASEANVEEIVVTSRTFKEKLQDVPLAVSVITNEQMERQGINNLDGIAEKTVGFAFEDFAGLLAQPSIRGQINLRTTSPVQNVATYVDGIYIQRGYLIDQSLLDLERVEIIKGPQSALYGRNSFAGVINVNTRRADIDNFTGKAKIGVGTDKLFEISGSLSAPIIPGKLAIGVHVAHTSFDGTWENNHPLKDEAAANTRGNVGGYRKEAYQFNIIAKPVEGLTIDAMFVRTDRKLELPATYVLATAGLTEPINRLNCSPVAGQNRLYCGEVTTDIVIPAGDTRLPGILVDPRAFGLRGPTKLASAKVQYDFTDTLAAAYQFGWVRGNVQTRGQSSSNPLRPILFGPANLGTLFDSSGTGSGFEGFSHDFKLTFTSERIKAFVGLNYSDTQDIDSNASQTAPSNALDMPNEAIQLFPIGPGLPFPANPLNPFQRFSYVQRNEEVIGIYGFVEATILEALTASFEGRYTIENRDALDLLTRQPGNTTVQALVPPGFSETEKFFTPRFSLKYAFTQNNNVFASVARGVKAGGFNSFTPNVAQRSYKAETNWTYEIGSKNYFPDFGLTLNGAVFHTDWRNLQNNVVRLNADGTLPSVVFSVPTVTGNIGSVSVWGAEVEGKIKIANGLAADFGAAYSRSRYKDGQVSQRFTASLNCDGIVCPTGPLQLGGNQVERTPAFDAYFGLGYSGNFGERGSYYLRGDMTYQTKQYLNEANIGFLPSRFLVNAQAGVGFGPVDVGLWVRNLTNKKYVSNALFLVGVNGQRTASVVPFFGDLRTAGLTLSYKF
jgi:iron complex outermembrane recepter protein